MVCSIALFVLVAQVSPEVDFQVRATTLSTALGKLSRQTGQTFVPSPEIQNEIVCVKVQGVKLSELTDRLAQVVTAAWIQDGDKQILRRTPEQIREMEQQAFIARRDRLQKLFDAKAKELAALATPHAQAETFLKAIQTLNDQAAANPQGLSLDGPRLAAPVSTLANLLAIDLGADVIAAIPEGEKRVFTQKPNRAQFALGPNAAGIIRNYEDAEAQLTSLVNTPSSNQSGWGQGLLDDIFDRKLASEPLGKIHLVVSNRGRSTSFNASVFNKSGIQRSWGLAGSYFLGDDPRQEEREAGQGKSPEWVTISEGTREFVKHAELEPNVFGFPKPARSWSELSDAAKKIILNPETIDPLSLAATDAVYHLATAPSPNVVAYLGDAMADARLAVEEGKMNLTRLKALLPVKGHKVAQSRGWTMVQPTSALSVTRFRMSRTAMGTFLRRVASAGHIDLESYCRYHFQAGGAIQYSVVERLYRRTLENYGVIPLGDQSSHSHISYAALGSLNSTQWKNILAGNPIRFGQLPAPQRVAGERWILGDSYNLKTEPSIQVSDLMMQPTEFAPNGLSRDTLLSASVDSNYVLRSINKIRDASGREYEGSMEPTGKTAMQRASAFAKGGYYKSVEHFREDISKGKWECAERTDVTFRFQFLDTHWIEEAFRGAPSNVKVLTFDKLPQSVQKEFLETFEREFKARSAGN